MSEPENPKAALLAAAHNAKDICAYLASFPEDLSAVGPLREAALEIDRTAQFIKMRELRELSSQFLNASSGIITSDKGIRKLIRILTQILLMAEMLSGNEPVDARQPSGSIQQPEMDPILPNTQTRWKTR